jgi:sialate O-acetylesterase
MTKELPADADIWILAGQSNMAGFGQGEPDEEPSDRVWLYSLSDAWDIAREPFTIDRYDAVDEAFAIMRGEREKHFADPNYRREMAKTWRGSGAGLGLRFGKRLSEYTGRPVGLLFCAKGDTRMEEWDPEYNGHPYMALYAAMLRRVRKVNRPIKGVLWDQGASDTFGGRGALYADRMKKFVAALRRDLNQPDLPFFFTQMGVFPLQTEEELPDFNFVQETQRLLEPILAPGGMTCCIDLPAYDHYGHLSTAAYKRHGERFAKIVRRQLYKDQSIEIGPRPISVERDSSDTYALRVHYTSVNDRLLPNDHIGGFSLLWPDSNRNMIGAALVSPESKSTVIIRTVRPTPPGSALWYGKGLMPYCNLVDAADLAAPVFGPWKI